VERRRRFSVEQRLLVLAEATAPGANMSEVVRRHGLVPAQMYKWRRLAELGDIGVPGASELPSFVAVEITKMSCHCRPWFPKASRLRSMTAPSPAQEARLSRSSWRMGTRFVLTATLTPRR
jgi:transposase-like protein